MNLCCMNALLAPSRTPFHHFLALREPNAFSLAHLPRNPWYILRILTIWTSNNPRRIFSAHISFPFPVLDMPFHHYLATQQHLASWFHFRHTCMDLPVGRCHRTKWHLLLD